MLNGQVALVTGCGRFRGLGRTIALQLADAGADLVVTDVSPGGTRNEGESADPTEANWTGLPSLVEELEKKGVRALGVVGDIGVKADADRMVDEAVQKMGKVDILVNNAGAPQGADRGWTWEVPEEAFDNVMRINTKGVFLMSGALARHLIGRDARAGRIINIASGAGKRGSPQRAAYCTSKFAIIGLTQVMALELADRNITVNALCPGAMDTPRQSARMGRAGSSAADSQHAAPPPSPIKRLGTPDDIARAVVFLADPAGDFITGQSINVDGGIIMS